MYSETNPAHNLPIYCLQVHFHIILPSVPLFQ
jgi:hypothetical protein